VLDQPLLVQVTVGLPTKPPAVLHTPVQGVSVFAQLAGQTPLARTAVGVPEQTVMTQVNKGAGSTGRHGWAAVVSDCAGV
jgi:hypothetical protein